eukprot:m.29173 g.29173  ORF g.29173 m.29173 type:complete len:235 (+) comp6125_c0_seq1:113-817(+)
MSSNPLRRSSRRRKPRESREDNLNLLESERVALYRVLRASLRETHQKPVLEERQQKEQQGGSACKEEQLLSRSGKLEESYQHQKSPNQKISRRGKRNPHHLSQEEKLGLKTKEKQEREEREEQESEKLTSSEEPKNDQDTTEKGIKKSSSNKIKRAKGPSKRQLSVSTCTFSSRHRVPEVTVRKFSATAVDVLSVFTTPLFEVQPRISALIDKSKPSVADLVAEPESSKSKERR